MSKNRVVTMPLVVALSLALLLTGCTGGEGRGGEAQDSGNRVAVVGGWLWDGTGNYPEPNRGILIQDSVFVSIGTELRDREIYNTDIVGMVQIRAVTLSPDGNTVAIWQMGNEDSAILVLPAAGGQAREILRGQLAQHDWMPDGRHLLIRIYDGEGFPPEMGTHLARVSVETGEVVDLGFSMEGAGQLKVNPDGRLLAFIDGAAAQEVWVMENFLPSDGPSNKP